MKIHLKSRWELKVLTIRPRVYYLGINANQFVNETFDEIQHFGCFKFTSFYMFFSFLIFIISKTAVNNKKKTQIVVNIGKFNNLVIFNTYFLPLQ